MSKNLAAQHLQKLSAQARWGKLSKAERSEIMKRIVRARWDKRDMTKAVPPETEQSIFKPRRRQFSLPPELSEFLNAEGRAANLSPSDYLKELIADSRRHNVQAHRLQARALQIRGDSQRILAEIKSVQASCSASIGKVKTVVR